LRVANEAKGSSPSRAREGRKRAGASFRGGLLEYRSRFLPPSPSVSSFPPSTWSYVVYVKPTWLRTWPGRRSRFLPAPRLCKN
jgi:hypothetical protein